ncbi:MAG: beta-ketoacyl-ACP synthase III [Bacteroidota bacterium]|jgi:3-oxoacyl-[acyl-carrier-protein] synthase-3|nr:beta-ketoacyl-ACP synthase III [Bacteroidota bacterium]
MITAAITAVGHYAPEKVVPNSYFESYLDTTDEWIVARTGIRERRWLEHGATSDLAVEAARRALAMRGIGPEEIECIIIATVTPDMFFPSTAALVQHKLGATNAWGFDLSGACSGFLFALATGVQFITAGTHKKVLVIGADKMTSIMDLEDRNTCILFGDGGGAVLLEPNQEEGYGVLDWVNFLDGSGMEALHMKAGGSAHPATMETVQNKMHYITQDGKAVFKVAVVGMADVSVDIMTRNNLTSKDIAWLVPHQANMRIIQSTADRMGLEMERVMVNIDRYGNTTAATIPSCLAEYYADGHLKRGDNIVLASFGAGYTWGASLVRWSI